MHTVCVLYKIASLVDYTGLCEFEKCAYIVDGDFFFPFETGCSGGVAYSLDGDEAFVSFDADAHGALRHRTEIALSDAGLLEGFCLEVALYKEFLFNFLCHRLFVCKWFVGHTDDTLDGLEVVDVLHTLEVAVSNCLFDVFDFG